jgi:hypothetical protein
MMHFTTVTLAAADSDLAGALERWAIPLAGLAEDRDDALRAYNSLANRQPHARPIWQRALVALGEATDRLEGWLGDPDFPFIADLPEATVTGLRAERKAQLVEMCALMGVVAEARDAAGEAP